MKNRGNQILLAAAVVTAVLYVLILLGWVGVIPSPLHDPDDPFRFYQLEVYLYLGFHIVPCFFLQLLVCRVARKPVIRLIPIFLVLGVAAVFATLMFTASGWDTLGWGILLLLCIAPAVGYALAWAVYGISRLCQRSPRGTGEDHVPA